MARETGIEWTDATWNPIRGCSRVSEGCRHCYAEKIAYRFSDEGRPYHGLVGIGGKWNGQIKFIEEHLLDPLKWRKPQRIFVNSMSDLFHENVTDEMLDRIFAVMALCPQHTFQVLTKRPERMLEYLSRGGRRSEAMEAACDLAFDLQSLKVHARIPKPGNVTEIVYDRGVEGNEAGCKITVDWPLPNVWLGVSVERQEEADERIPLLLQTPAAVRFLSVEPLLGPITFRWAKWDDWTPNKRRGVQLPPVEREGRLKAGCVDQHDGLRMLDWVIVGGESGPGARPMHPDWARSLRDQCQAADVPFFFKQWGEWLPAMSDGALLPDGSQTLNCCDEPMRVGKKAAGHLLDGEVIQQFPEVCA